MSIVLINTKKRKAATAEASVKLAPQEKKLKRSLTETDEQWQKYVKKKTVDASKKPRAKTETKRQQPQEKKKKKSNPLLKPREACDLMRNEKRIEQLHSHVERLSEINETNAEQKTLAIHVLPQRARQTTETLSLGNHDEDHADHIVYNDVDFCMEMKKFNYSRASTGQSYALQDLMGDQGFFSSNNEHVDQIVGCVFDDLRNDIKYARMTQAEAAAATTAATAESTNACGDTTNKKLNCIFGGVFYSFGYNRKTPQLQHKKIKTQDDIDQEERFNAFYKYDQLETETNFGEVPENFKMFRELRRDNMAKYLKRDETLRLSASLTPKTDVEIVTKEYIAKFREPPGQNEQCCANQQQCIFNTFSDDKNVCYIGKVFYTENERAKGCVSNTHRLCYDCLILKWTIEWSLNIRHGNVVERAINYFTVLCKPGQYSLHCMLSVVENDKLTGIVGHVPRFSRNNRRIVMLLRRRKGDDGKYHEISVPVLAETGMDF